jgi:Cdc6-like AAA superfamily ATPase
MKFYESHYEEYIESKDHYNIHPELKIALENTPTKISQMGNMIFYGPSGVGKYTQVLSLLKKYSSTDLKYDKKIT